MFWLALVLRYECNLNKTMSLPTINSHLEKYKDLNGKTFIKDKMRHRVNIGAYIIKYPYKALKWDGSIENLDCPDEYKFSCLNNYESFDTWSVKLEKMLDTENKNRWRENQLKGISNTQINLEAQKLSAAAENNNIGWKTNL